MTTTRLRPAVITAEMIAEMTARVGCRKRMLGPTRETEQGITTQAMVTAHLFGIQVDFVTDLPVTYVTYFGDGREMDLRFRMDSSGIVITRARLAILENMGDNQFWFDCVGLP